MLKLFYTNCYPETHLLYQMEVLRLYQLTQGLTDISEWQKYRKYRCRNFQKTDSPNIFPIFPDNENIENIGM